MQLRQTVNRLWERLASPRTALLILVVLSLIQITALALPQIPVPPSQSTTYNRWLAEFRPRLGPQTGLLASLGLLTVRSSLAMRLTLGLLGLLVAANLDGLMAPALQDTSLRDDEPADPVTAQIDSEEAENDGSDLQEDEVLADSSPEALRPAYASLMRTGCILLVIGGLLAIGGWAAQMLWGWQEPGVISWPGTEIALPQHDLTFKQPDGVLGFWKGKVGLYVLNRGKRTGLEVQATQDDAPLLLLPAVNEDPQEVLRLALTPQEPEAFFATEEAALIFRLVQIPDAIQAQAYRSPSGEMVAEALLSSTETPLVLNLENVDVIFTPVLLPYYEVFYNPGAVFEAVGMVCLLVGTVIQIWVSRQHDRERSVAVPPDEE